jgi:hypothetical protein
MQEPRLLDDRKAVFINTYPARTSRMSRFSEMHVFLPPCIAPPLQRQAQEPWERRWSANGQRGEKQTKRQEGICVGIRSGVCVRRMTRRGDKAGKKSGAHKKARKKDEALKEERRGWR